MREYIYLPAERRNIKDKHESSVGGQRLKGRLFFYSPAGNKKDDVDVSHVEMKTISVAATENHKRYSMGLFLLLVNEYCPHKSNKERRKTNGDQTNVSTSAQNQSCEKELCNGDI